MGSFSGSSWLWTGNDKQKRYRPITVEAGESYSVMAMGMKQMPAAD